MMPIVVEGCHLYCWACGALEQMSKVCPDKNMVLPPSQTAAAETAEMSSKAPSASQTI